MPSAISVAARVMADDMFRLDVISQNLANAQTTAYKKELVAARPFAEHLEAGGQRIPVSLPALASVLDLRQGALSRTGNALDLAIDGEGFFEIAGRDGPLYTRQGSFRLDASGRLVSPSGLPVSGASGEIRLTSASPVVDRLGRVLEGDRVVDQLKIVRFASSDALTPLGGGLYRADGQGEAALDALQVRQGFVEASNVQSLPEMVRMIELMRRFETTQKVVQSYDGMLGTAIGKLGEF
jgi:flagellar basal-body rod protein FlgG